MSEPMTKAGRDWMRQMERNEFWHPSDGRRDAAASAVRAIEQEAGQMVARLGLTDDHQLCDEQKREAAGEMAARVLELRRTVSFLRSCVLGGERLSPDDLLAVDAILANPSKAAADWLAAHDEEVQAAERERLSDRYIDAIDCGCDKGRACGGMTCSGAEQGS